MIGRFLPMIVSQANSVAFLRTRKNSFSRVGGSERNRRDGSAAGSVQEMYGTRIVTSCETSAAWPRQWSRAGALRTTPGTAGQQNFSRLGCSRDRKSRP